MYNDYSFADIDDLLLKTQNAFTTYKNSPIKLRADFMRQIAQNLALAQNELIAAAKAETNLSETRLQAELKRTQFQLNSYADALERGDWLEARIDTADWERKPPKPDLRKMRVALGPVLVFGAANFPFAYSTAGGDTACALAAGCPVVVKAHPEHAHTSTLTAEAIQKAAAQLQLPEGIFGHVYGADFKVGEYLAKHPIIKAIGFTGSRSGGKAIFDTAQQRPDPIPVFAEMSSVNPVFLLPDKLKNDFQAVSEQLKRSITQDMGQFCTKPGLLIAQQGEELDWFVKQLTTDMHQAIPQKMLNKPIAANYLSKMQTAMMQRHVDVLYQSGNIIKEYDGMIALAQIPARYFLSNPLLSEEVFGPFSLIIVCKDKEELLLVARKLSGQLTTTLIAEDEELNDYTDLISVLQEKCGRLVFNGVPTGVEVTLAMQHGGPFPSTTDSRFGAVGADGIQRFTRPLTYQNWNDSLLPEALKNKNSLNIWRCVNNEMTQSDIKL